MIELDVFTASWCKMCTVFENQINSIPPNCKVNIKSCDDEDVFNEANSWFIKSLPTSILFNDKHEEITRFVGIVSTKTINDKIKEYESKCMV